MEQSAFSWWITSSFREIWILLPWFRRCNICSMEDVVVVMVTTLVMDSKQFRPRILFYLILSNAL